MDDDASVCRATKVVCELPLDVHRCAHGAVRPLGLAPAQLTAAASAHALQDPQYRTTVAAMLAQQTADEAQPSQFIVTTFHPQIIQQADKVYGVSHTNRISRIEVVTQVRLHTRAGSHAA